MTKIKLQERLKELIRDQLLILDGLVMQYYFADDTAMAANKKDINEDITNFYWTAGGLQSKGTRAVSLNLTPEAHVNVRITTGVVPDTVTAVAPETSGDE